jgi:hypothetical protein
MGYLFSLTLWILSYWAGDRGCSPGSPGRRSATVSEYDPERSNRALHDPDRGWDRHLGGWCGRRLTTLSASGYEGQPVFKGLYGSNNIGM